MVESEDVVSAGVEAAGNNDYQVLIYCSGGRNNLTLILCKASNGELRRQILRLASVHSTRPINGLNINQLVLSHSDRHFHTFKMFSFKRLN